MSKVGDDIRLSKDEQVTIKAITAYDTWVQALDDWCDTTGIRFNIHTLSRKYNISGKAIMLCTNEQLAYKIEVKKGIINE